MKTNKERKLSRKYKVLGGTLLKMQKEDRERNIKKLLGERIKRKILDKRVLSLLRKRRCL